MASMEVLQNRLDSFKIKRGKPSSKASASSSKKWPHPSVFKANPETLAEAGFYFTPTAQDKDNVACYMCKKHLSDWEEDDDPHRIHWAKCQDTCPWAIVRCGLEEDIDEDGNFVATDAKRLPSGKAMEKARLDTFRFSKSWPHDSAKNHGATSKKMAKAGFVYTPQSEGDDTATCLYCSVSLSGWEPEDDPLEEHRKRADRSGKPCPFFSATLPEPAPAPAPAPASKPPSSKASRSRSRTRPKAAETESEEDEVATGPPSTSSSKRSKKSVASSLTKTPASSVAKTPASRRSTRSTAKTPKSRLGTSDLEDEGSTNEGSTLLRKSSRGRKGKEKIDVIEEEQEEPEEEEPEPAKLTKKTTKAKTSGKSGGKRSKKTSPVASSGESELEEPVKPPSAPRTKLSTKTKAKSKKPPAAVEREPSPVGQQDEQEDEEEEENGAPAPEPTAKSGATAATDSEPDSFVTAGDGAGSQPVVPSQRSGHDEREDDVVDDDVPMSGGLDMPPVPDSLIHGHRSEASAKANRSRSTSRSNVKAEAAVARDAALSKLQSNQPTDSSRNPLAKTETGASSTKSRHKGEITVKSVAVTHTPREDMGAPGNRSADPAGNPSTSDTPREDGASRAGPSNPADDPSDTFAPLIEESIKAASPVSEGERQMTLEQWIRKEIDLEAARKRRHMDELMRMFREQAVEVRRHIEALAIID